MFVLIMLILPLVLFNEKILNNLKFLDVLPFQYQILKYKIVYFDLIRSRVKNQLNHNKLLELIWTFIPIFILLFLAYPTFLALIALDESLYNDYSEISIHVIGKQWNWEYKIEDTTYNLEYQFDSYILEDKYLKFGDLRLLEVDKPLVLPCNKTIRFLVTSEDVIHSWSIPSFGLKIDAVPGRLNSITTKIFYEGLYFGQCSELCGVNHGYMPIKVLVIEYSDYLNYLGFFDENLKTNNEIISIHNNY